MLLLYRSFRNYYPKTTILGEKEFEYFQSLGRKHKNIIRRNFKKLEFHVIEYTAMRSKAYILATLTILIS